MRKVARESPLPVSSSSASSIPVLSTKRLVLVLGWVSLVFSISFSGSYNFYQDIPAMPNAPPTKNEKFPPSLSPSSLRNFSLDNQEPISRIYLLGERNSATNFLNEALEAAFLPYGKGEQRFQSNVPVLNYKHMVRSSCLLQLL